MIKPIVAVILLLAAVMTAAAQVDNAAIAKRISDLKASKQIRLEPNAGGNTTKLIAVADNFSRSESKTAGIEAMNFAIAAIYAGQSLTVSTDPIDLAFWVLTKKPQFAAAHDLKVKLADTTIDLGSARYAGKSGEQMEYLNFRIARADLERIAKSPSATITLGRFQFTFTQSQLELFRSFLSVTAIP